MRNLEEVRERRKYEYKTEALKEQVEKEAEEWIKCNVDKHFKGDIYVSDGWYPLQAKWYQLCGQVDYDYLTVDAYLRQRTCDDRAYLLRYNKSSKTFEFIKEYRRDVAYEEF